MNSEQSSATTPRSNVLLKRVAVIVGCCLIGFCLLSTLIYIFVIPSKIELVIGQDLPKTAKVVNSQYDYVPHDPIHRFAIAFTDDQARDLLITKYKLTNNPSDIMGSNSTHAAAWWPVTRLQEIEKNGDCYGRVDSATEQWWTVWVDRKTNMLYLEAGNW